MIPELQVVQAFARAAEALNAYSRALNADGLQAITGADIRHYVEGPKLEKWIEQESGESDVVYCWWLELGTGDGCATIEANVSSTDGLHRPWEGRQATDIAGISAGLSDA